MGAGEHVTLAIGFAVGIIVGHVGRRCCRRHHGWSRWRGSVPSHTDASATRSVGRRLA